MKYKSATQQLMLWNAAAGIKKKSEPERREGGKFFFSSFRLTAAKKTPQQVRSSKFIYLDTYFCLYTTDGSKDHADF